MTLHNYSLTSPCGSLVSTSKDAPGDAAQQGTIIIDCAGALVADDTLALSSRAAAAHSLLDDLARALARVIVDMHAGGLPADQEPPP